MSRALQQGFGALSDYFLRRLEMKMNEEAEVRQDTRRRASWREDQAAIGERSRGLSTEIVGGNVFDVDKGEKWDAEKNAWAPVEYGRRLTPPVTRGSNYSRVVLADGSHANHSDTDPLPPGAKFYDAAAERPAKGSGRSAREPRPETSQWVINETTGEEELRTPTEIRQGGYGRAPTDEKGKVRAEANRAWRQTELTIGNNIATFLGRGRKPEASASAPPQLDDVDQQQLAIARQMIDENPAARATIEDRLRKGGFENLIPLLAGK